MNHFATFRLLAGIIYAGACLCQLTACTPNTVRTIQFLLPENYRGMIKIVHDPNEYTIPERTNDVLLVRVPPNGVIKLRDTSPFNDWHSVRAVSNSGAEIPHAMGIGSDLDKVGFHSVSSLANNGPIYYFIGTLQELEHIRKAGPWKYDNFLPTVSEEN